MDILLYKDGHLTISESPLQGKENNLDDAVMLISNPQEGDTLTYKSGKWVNGEGGGGGFSPDITNPQDGDTLVYDATAQKWVNGSGGGGAMLLTVTETTEGNTSTYTLNKTWKEIKDALSEGTRVVLNGEGTGNNAGKYAQFTVDGVGVYDGNYMVYNWTGHISGPYEWFVLGMDDNEFSTNSEDGYPMVTIYEGNESY